MSERTLDSTGGASAFTHGGKVRVELWCEDRAPSTGPLVVLMTPGQAMALCSRLAASAAQALADALKP